MSYDDKSIDPTIVPDWAKNQCPHGVHNPADCFHCQKDDADGNKDNQGAK